jgi:hypothetical protein
LTNSTEFIGCHIEVAQEEEEEEEVFKRYEEHFI